MVQKVTIKLEFKAGLCHAATGKLCQPSSKWVPYSNKGRIRQRKERNGLHFSSAVPKIQWDSNPTASMAIRLWETFTFLNMTQVITCQKCLENHKNCHS